MFITAFASARHLSLSWASSIQSISPHPISWRSIPILFSHLCLGLPIGFFPSGFPPKPCIRLSHPHTRYMPSPSHSSPFYPRTILGEQYRSLSSSVYSFIQPSVPLSFLGPNIFLNNLFSNTLNLLSSLNVSDKVSHPYTLAIDKSEIILNINNSNWSS